MTPLQQVIDIINILKSNETVFTDVNIPINHAKLGVIQASLAISREYNFITQNEEVYIDVDLSNKEIYICGLYAYRNFALQEHHKMTEKAINFKTISFALTGMTERAKEYMRIIWWCDSEIARTLGFLRSPIGYSSEMKGVDYSE